MMVDSRLGQHNCPARRVVGRPVEDGDCEAVVGHPGHWQAMDGGEHVPTADQRARAIGVGDAAAGQIFGA